MSHKYSDEQIKFITDHVAGKSTAELTEMFNSHFELSLKVTQLISFKKNHHITSGVDGKFKPGCIPFNKGRKGVDGWEPTQFKKGNKPHNYLPVGSERVNADDYIDVKIEDPKKWKGKHILTWEKYNGPVPKGFAVIFGDRNNRNFDIDNLILLSRPQLIVMNSKKLIQNDADLTRAGVIVADIYQKISSIKKNKE